MLLTLYRTTRKGHWRLHREIHVLLIGCITRKVTSAPVAHADVALICKLDEPWDFVGKKAQQHGLWYVYD
ncbi:IS1 family transposase [Pectobacterium versatile]|uniref:IS1 family transposase n=1 Tax=Pectobacterium versatile TaxID=2488639 RepID=UPI00398D182A